MQYHIHENTLDEQTYRSLRKSVGWADFNGEQIKQALDNSFYTITVEAGSDILGMGRVVGDGIYLTIVDIVVRPEFQRKGLGTLIMQSILKRIRNDMDEGSKISISLISEAGKEMFYEKLGFELIPNEHCGAAFQRILKK